MPDEYKMIERQGGDMLRHGAVTKLENPGIQHSEIPQKVFSTGPSAGFPSLLEKVLLGNRDFFYSPLINCVVRLFRLFL